MITEIFLEGYRLDVTADISSLLTFALDDVKDFGSRQTTFSKTVVLPGTANNDKLFGAIFDTGSSNTYDETLPNVGYNFNASKEANCIIFQDNLQTFSGILRLTEINRINGRNEYSINVFGNMARLNSALSPSAVNGTGLLENLDFSAYDHTYNETNISASWSNPGGSGYYYPHIDYGTYSIAKHDWKIGTFRPGLYAKEYIDKMFSVAGFTYDCELFNSTRFKSFIIPHNQKLLQRLTSLLLDATRNVTYNILNSGGGITSDYFQFTSAPSSSFTTVNPLTYAGTTLNTVFTYSLHGSITAGLPAGWIMSIRIKKNGVDIPGTTQTYVSAPGHTIPYTYAGVTTISIAPGDVIEFFFDGNGAGGSFVVTGDTTSYVNIMAQTPTLVPVIYGDTVLMNYVIPKNIKQIDFLVSIVKLFNLYVFEDAFDSTLIKIKPYNSDGINAGFFSALSTNAIDWTYKLNRDKNINIKPMSELNSKIYNFNYALDADYYNNQYKKRYNQGYGSYIFDSQFEFNTASENLQLIFASTPIVGYSGEDKIYSTIFKLNSTVEETIDSVIRLLQTKRVTGVTSWDLEDSAGAPLASYTEYGYAGHYDDPDAPDNDLNFGALQELYFVLVSGNLANTQFNVYWSPYMAEITDKDSKLLTAFFYLQPKDIFNLDFAKYILLDGVLFRLNSIIDYNASTPMDTKCTLLRVINTTYL